MKKAEGYIKLTPQETKELIDREKNLVIIDTRTEMEFTYEGKLENAILIDFLKPRIFKREIQKYDRNKTYLVYCAVGRVSQPACELMAELGFKNIYEMIGGLKAWQKDSELVTTVSKLDNEEIIETRKRIVTRLNKIEGQIRGMKKMLLDGEYCGDILNQSLAVKSALGSVNQEIMEMFSNVCITCPSDKEDFFKYLKKLMK
ncbi:metal-sensing transcriptional repressor [Fusobacterium perfoetens]|uniref:metal-sensing transcriptional repressor n=1 Tax=Fusobacterium perfoetens TaxID=852 RepID=UPI001F3CE87B|nr:metal-sensing transcriptional repressor [Fusobacterium perfoetens]MCF2625527.1 metal-sensing transcriptional repressor [Fusobacterium perfoetens]